MNNKKNGTDFERAFADSLAQSWFWVHIFQDNKNGQPCDVMAARNGHTYLFDCKDCQGDYFHLSRMEENQYNAMKLFELTRNSRGMFAVRFSENEIYLIQYWIIADLQNNGTKKLDRTGCRTHGIDFFQWLRNKNLTDGAKKNDSNDWK